MIPIWVQGVLVLLCIVLLLVLLGMVFGLIVDLFRSNGDTERRVKLYKRGFLAAGSEVVILVLNFLVVGMSPGAGIPPSDAVKELVSYIRHGTFRDCARCPLMVKVPTGDFMMGSPETDGERGDDEEPQHKVSISNRLEAVGVYEVTFEEWFECGLRGGCEIPKGTLVSGQSSRIGEALRGGWEDGLARRPVIYVTWEDAQDYVAWLRRRTDKAYRLLTEAEWEYVARAGSGNVRLWDNPQDQCLYANGVDSSWRVYDEITYSGTPASCSDNESGVANVGSYRRNEFGLYDVVGNVHEWTQDCWHENYQGAPEDGSSWEDDPCKYRVARGGAWFNFPEALRLAVRVGFPVATYRSNGVGLRVALGSGS